MHQKIESWFLLLQYALYKNMEINIGLLYIYEPKKHYYKDHQFYLYIICSKYRINDSGKYGVKIQRI